MRQWVFPVPSNLKGPVGVIATPMTGGGWNFEAKFDVVAWVAEDRMYITVGNLTDSDKYVKVAWEAFSY